MLHKDTRVLNRPGRNNLRFFLDRKSADCVSEELQVAFESNPAIRFACKAN